MSSIINSNFRLSGLATGLDTDSMVSQLIKVEKVPIDRLEQKKQLAEWKRDDYRDITNLLRGIKDEFFDIVNSDSYVLSEKAFKSFGVTSSDSSYVSAEGLTDAMAGSHSLVVSQLATSDKAESASSITKPLLSTPTDYSLSGKKVNITVDGVTREITMDNYSGLANLVDKANTGLQKLVDDAFGEGKVNVSYVASQLKIEPVAGSGVSEISLASGDTNDGLELLGFSSGDSNRISTQSTLEDLSSKLSTALTFDESDNVVFSINGEEFTFAKDTKFSEVINTVNNNTNANVQMAYDEVTDKLSITAKQLGAGDNIKLGSTGGNFFEALGIDSSNPVTTQGQDAMVSIDGQTVTRSSNVFSVNGVKYTLHKEHDADNPDDTITLAQDIDAVYDRISDFVGKYNEVIDKINNKLVEKYDRNYTPLNEEQKESMSEDDIKKWEEKAKTGLLRNDSILSKVVTDMRMALLDSVEGTGLSLSSIGISSKSYMDKGKLHIDENRLKEAIRNKPDEVKNLFIKKSDTVPSYKRDISSEDRSIRYKEQGLLFRISDIIEDNISLYRDNNGRKGILVEKAGIQGDATEFNNTLNKNIVQYEEDIAELYDKLYRKESSYYQQFARLETAMNEMNSQMNWLMSQLGGGSG